MMTDTIQNQPIEMPVPVELPSPSQRHKTSVRAVRNLWNACRNLNNALSQQEPRRVRKRTDGHKYPHPPTPDSPSMRKPPSQKSFHVWVVENHTRVFHCQDSLTIDRLIPAEAPVVPSLTIYAATDTHTGTKFYGAWTTAWGNLVGWMRLSPQVVGIDMVHVAGEVLGLAIFPAGQDDVSADRALDKFALALKEVAWDLGIA